MTPSSTVMGACRPWLQSKAKNNHWNKQCCKREMAFVYPATGDVDVLLAAENAARQANKAYWTYHPDISSDDAEKLYGSYGFVSGIVTKVERVKNKVYLNLGADWHINFTVEIAAHDLRAFKNKDIDVLALQGKKLRVRGWVKSDFAPMLQITDTHQMEILP